MPDQLKDSKHNYDEEYTKGAHWDTEKSSSNMPLFLEHLAAGDYILDVGCGTGRDDRFLSQKGFRVMGIDGSKVAIEMARQRSADFPNIQYRVASAENLPFLAATFDAVYSGYVLGGETLPQQVSEIARVIKPRGLLYVAMFTRTQYDSPSERDESNPLPVILPIFQKHFDLKGEPKVDTYSEDDDQGKHEHDRLRLIATRKSAY